LLKDADGHAGIDGLVSADQCRPVASRAGTLGDRQGVARRVPGAVRPGRGALRPAALHRRCDGELRAVGAGDLGDGGHGLLGLLPCHHQGRSRLGDSRLLAGDGVQRVAEDVHVVVADGGDGRHHRSQEVGGVEAAA